MNYETRTVKVSVAPKGEPLFHNGVTNIEIIDEAREERDRFTIRPPCWICDKCGWRERREAEVWCWKCGKSRGGQMLYTPNKEITQ